MDYSIGKGYYPGVGITVDPPKGGGNGKSSSSSSSEEFSKKTKDLTKHAEASSPPSTPRAPSKGISIDKLADLRVGYDSIFKKSTIDLPKGPKPAFACALAETIGRLLGEKEGDKHRIKVTEKGAHYQIRFRTEKGGVGPESIQAFIRRLITACKDLGIEDEAALARFVRKCPMLASAFGDRRIWFRYGLTIASVMTSHEDEACVREALKQKNFSFIGLFLPCLREHQSAAYEVAVSATFKDAQENISAKSFDLAEERLIILAKSANEDNDLENKLLGFLVDNWKYFPGATNIVYPHLSYDGKKSVESLVASINCPADFEEWKTDLGKAGLITKWEGRSFHFACRDQGTFHFESTHTELAMQLAKIWALDPGADLMHVLDIINYVYAQSEPDEHLIEIGNELVKLVKYSPLLEVRKRLVEIEAAVTRLEMKKEMIERASELEEEFGYSIRKEKNSGQYRLGRDSSKDMKRFEFQSLEKVVVSAARAGEMGLIMDAITLVRRSNQADAQNMYLTALGWLESNSDKAALRETFAKDFRIGIASEIEKIVRNGRFWDARSLFKRSGDDELLPLLIQLIPANQRKGLAEKPTIDDVLVRLLNRKAG